MALRDSPVSDAPLPGSADAIGSDGYRMSTAAIIESIATSNLAGAMARANRLVIDGELTERVLEARAWKARAGRWPTDLPNLGTSRIPGERWIYSVGADGRLTISFSRKLLWKDQQGLMLPLVWESE